jgi:hypothetical protein
MSFLLHPEPTFGCQQSIDWNICCGTAALQLPGSYKEISFKLLLVRAVHSFSSYY